MFSIVKHRLKDFEFKKKEKLTEKIAEIFFSLTVKEFYGFFNRTLDNILKFWIYTNFNKLLNNNNNENLPPMRN